MTTALLLILALTACLGFVFLTAWKPVLGCGLFALLISLTTGLGRGTIVPILRPNEAILLMLLAGLLIRRLGHWEQRPITSLDLALGCFAVGGIVTPALVLFVSRSPDLYSVDTLRNVLAPAQLFLVYLVFSRTPMSERERALVLNFTMAASIIVGLIAVAELIDLPGVRDFIATNYPPNPVPPSWDTLYRPTSTLGHYSAVGAFGALNFLLALALATTRHPGFNRWWLSVVMAVNLVALVTSLTWAPLLVLPLATVVVLLLARHIPRELGVAVAGLALAFVLAWPSVSTRSDQQGTFQAGQVLVIPQTFQHRMDLWQAFFMPALLDHVLVGTGTVIPSLVPDHLILFVDNEYIREGYRAGLIGIGLLLIMLGGIALAGWRARFSPVPTIRALGRTSLALVLFVGLIGVTAEYLFFGGVSQEFAMIAGFLGAGAVAPISTSSAR